MMVKVKVSSRLRMELKAEPRDAVKGSASIEDHDMNNDKQHQLQFDSTNGQFTIGEHLVAPGTEVLIKIYNEWRPVVFKLDDSMDSVPEIERWTVETSGPHEVAGFPAGLFVGYPAACEEAELYDYYHLEDLSCLRSERAYHHLDAICTGIRRELWMVGLRVQALAWRRPKLRKFEIQTLFEIDQKVGELATVIGEVQRRGELLQDKVMRYAELYGWLSARQMLARIPNANTDEDAAAAADSSPFNWWKSDQCPDNTGNASHFIKDDVIPF